MEIASPIEAVILAKYLDQRRAKDSFLLFVGEILFQLSCNA
jgi:hypothetical protein